MFGTKLLKFWSVRLLIFGLALFAVSWLEYSVFTVHSECGTACPPGFFDPINLWAESSFCTLQCVNGYFPNPNYGTLLQGSVFFLLAAAFAYILEGKRVPKRRNRRQRKRR